MESTLDIKPRLELLAFLGIINVIDELVDPVFDRTVHLIVSGIALLEGNRRFTGCIHEIHATSSTFSERAAPLGARKNTAVLSLLSEVAVRSTTLVTIDVQDVRCVSHTWSSTNADRLNQFIEDSQCSTNYRFCVDIGKQTLYTDRCTLE